MSQFMMDSGHRWMRRCDTCDGWHHCAEPKDKHAEPDWNCRTCAATEPDAKDATIKALGDSLLRVHRATGINPPDAQGAEAEAHFTRRLAAKIEAALRLAGRLP